VIPDTSSNGVKQNRNKTIINKSGLYRLILRSNLPEAEAFQDWVTDEVLPAVMDNGADVHSDNISLDHG